jgi:hypothetical protein
MSFSKNSPVEIEYIVIIRDIAQVSCDVHQNKKMLHVPVLGCTWKQPWNIKKVE